MRLKDVKAMKITLLMMTSSKATKKMKVMAKQMLVNAFTVVVMSK